MSLKRTTWHHIRRSPFQSLAALIVVSFTCFLFVLFFITSQGLSNTLTYFETKPEITIFLKDGLSKEIVESIQQSLSEYDQVREIRFISKDQALSIYQEQNKDNPLLLEMVTADILPASFEVSANTPQTLENIQQDFKNRTDVVDELIYQKDIVSSLLKWTKTIRYVGTVFIFLFSTVSFMVIFTIIGMKITTRKDEIKISRLLGASRSYVCRPFMVEGFFYGLLGSLIGNMLILILAIYFSDDINNFFRPIVFINMDYLNIAKIFGLATIISTFITYIASLFSVKRYFKF